jgi:hypothetical protein
MPSKNDPFAGKHREPMIRLAQLIRTLDYRSPDNNWRIGDTTDSTWGIGQSPQSAKNVFNFFRPNYAPPGSEISKKKLVTPEMQIVTETSTISQANFWYKLLNEPQRITKRKYTLVEKGRLRQHNLIDQETPGLSLFLEEEKKMAVNPSSLVERFDTLFSCGQLSKATKESIVESINKLPIDSNDRSARESYKKNRVIGALLMVITNPEYIVLK